MERLWAPWRMEYIVSGKPDGCVFCVDTNQEADRERLLLYRSARSFVMLNLYPYTNGHLMVIPYRHTASLPDLDSEELLDLIGTLRLTQQVLERALAPQGYNIGMNLGKAAGAGIAEHLHFHIVPRWDGDTNYMAVVADTRVVPEALLTTYDRLHPVFLELVRCEERNEF